MNLAHRNLFPLLLTLLALCLSVTACDQAETPYNLEILAVRPAD